MANPNVTFANATKYATGTPHYQLVIGDLNGDGKADLATAASATGDNDREAVSVLLGNGDGTFQAPTSFGLEDSPFFRLRSVTSTATAGRTL